MTEEMSETIEQAVVRAGWRGFSEVLKSERTRAHLVHFDLDVG